MSETSISPDLQPQICPARPSSEIVEKATRRRFNAEFKKLRREGLYCSHLSLWREQRDQPVYSRPHGFAGQTCTG